MKTFTDRNVDPAFLVAKGRFNCDSELELHDLLRDGVKSNDPRIIDLKNKIDEERNFLERKHVKNLANAIFKVVSTHGHVNIRCIGRNAVYNACKAMAIARGHAYSCGLDLLFSPTFNEGNLGQLQNSHHVENVTAMVFSLQAFNTVNPEMEKNHGKH